MVSQSEIRRESTSTPAEQEDGRPDGPKAGLRKGAGTARTERTRRRILRAAGECFAERGIKTTVEEIARRAGISKALVYNYFDGKESLLRWVLDQTLREWSEHNWSEVARLAPDSALDGLGDIDPTALAGGFVEYQNGPWRGAVIGMAALPGDVEGWGLRIRGSYDYKVQDNLIVTPILGTTYFSSDYNQTYFVITPSQSARSGRPAFSPDGGFWNVGGGVNARYLFDENWGLLGALGYQRITGDAADSPLVDDEGSANQYFGSLVVFYAF